jgi:hypothetical protein
VPPPSTAASCTSARPTAASWPTGSDRPS